MNETLESMAHYAWALLNNACEPVTQAEFDKLALVPTERTETLTVQANRR